MLGYMAQAEYALLRAVDALLDGDLAMRFAIELEDDFSAKSKELAHNEWWQTKHSVDSERELKDGDLEFWKTISIWLRTRSASESTRFFFLTTASCGDQSALRHLRAEDRDPGTAADGLDAARQNSGSALMAERSKEWLDLTVAQRVAFLDLVEVVFDAPQADELHEQLVRRVRPCFGPRFSSAGATALSGWWLNRVRTHLMSFWNDSLAYIDLLDMELEMDAIRNRLRDDDLPIAVDIGELPVSGEDRNFVIQLRLIALLDERVALCIQDHNRAFFNRSYWQRESLVRVGELETYDDRLKTAWKRHFLPATTSTHKAETPDEDMVCAAARDRYLALESSQLPRIRHGVSEEFIATGSLHILADRLEVGWHPEWFARLKGVLTDAADPQAGVA